MRKSEKNAFFSKSWNGRILISWNLIVDTFFCTKIKKFTIVNFFSLDTYSDPMCTGLYRAKNRAGTGLYWAVMNCTRRTWTMQDYTGRLNGLYRTVLYCTELYWAVLNCTRLSWAALDCTGIIWVKLWWTVLHQTVLGCAGMNRTILCWTKPYWAVLDSTELYWTVVGCSEMY